MLGEILSKEKNVKYPRDFEADKTFCRDLWSRDESVYYEITLIGHGFALATR